MFFEWDMIIEQNEIEICFIQQFLAIMALSVQPISYNLYVYILNNCYNKDFEEILDWPMPSRKKNFAIFNTALILKFCISVTYKLVIQVWSV